MFTTSNLQITAEILLLISEIDEFKGAWRSLSTLAPERLLALRRVATIESIGSSTRIEGSKLTDAEIETLLANLEMGSFETRDAQEVAGYADVMETIFAAWEDIDLTENHIRQLHRDILHHSTKDERHRGSWKTSSNSVAAFDGEGRQVAIIFETATPFETPTLMAELIEWHRTATIDRKMHPLLLTAIFVVVFLEIHPFQDGNGRLSRALTTLLLLRAGYAYVAFSSLESVIEQSKEAYYLALRQTQSTIRTEQPNWEPWTVFFLKALQKQMSRLKTKVEREKLMMGKLSDLSAKLFELVREQGRLTIADAARATGASRNTIKQHLQRLVKEGHLRLNGAGRGAWYSRA
jgi:Fic family protein